MKTLKTIIAVTLLLFIFSLICKAETDLGIGIVSINFGGKTNVHFYKNPGDSKPTKTVEFFDDKSIKSWNIKNLERHKQWLAPELLSVYFSSLNFRCKSKNKSWFQVIVNNRTGKTFWIKKEKFTEFSTWKTFLKSKFVVERLSKYNQAIRKLPSNNSAKIKYIGGDCFEVKSMKGDWIEIFTSDFCKSGYGESKKTVLKSGWIRWKTGNTLLIEYQFAD